MSDDNEDLTRLLQVCHYFNDFDWNKYRVVIRRRVKNNEYLLQTKFALNVNSCMVLNPVSDNSHKCHFPKTMTRLMIVCRSIDMLCLPKRMIVIYVGQLSVERCSPREKTPEYFSSTLETLCLIGQFNRSLENFIFPVTLRELKLGHQFNQRIDGISTAIGLKKLTFGSSFNQSLNGKLPLGLETLLFQCNDKFNKELKGELPISLKHLCLPFNFRGSLGTLPPELLTIEFGSEVQLSLPFPLTIKIVSIHGIFGAQSWKLDDLPLTIELLVMDNDNWRNNPTSMKDVALLTPAYFHRPDDVIALNKYGQCKISFHFNV